MGAARRLHQVAPPLNLLACEGSGCRVVLRLCGFFRAITEGKFILAVDEHGAAQKAVHDLDFHLAGGQKPHATARGRKKRNFEVVP